MALVGSKAFARYLVVAALVAGSLASCRATASRPLSESELRSRLLTAASAPAGTTVLDTGSGSDASSTGHGSPRSGASCEDLIDPRLFISADAVAPASSAGESVRGRTSTGETWLAGEDLFSYRAGQAHTVIQDLRRLVAKCSTFIDPNSLGTPSVRTFSIGAGPKLGDESLLVHQESRPQSYNGDNRLVHDAILIRSGDVVLVVSTVTSTLLNVSTPMLDVAAAAFKANARKLSIVAGHWVGDECDVVVHCGGCLLAGVAFGGVGRLRAFHCAG